MLYVFLVDTGTMMTFDMNLALENVSALKEVIHRSMKVPPEKQVLLISGGEALDPNLRVCQYSAGTDTNPIFLFSKTTIEGQTPPSPSIDYGADTDLKDQVEGALNMPASYNTVVARAQLAQSFHEHSRDQTRICQQLVHDQHLQQQGWAAVVANLEDIVSAFKNRFENFELSFNDYLKGREEKFAILENFEEDLKLLSRIPVLPALLGGSAQNTELKLTQVSQLVGTKFDEGESGEDEGTEEAFSAAGDCSTVIAGTTSLLDWISAKDRQNDVQQIAQLCFRGLTQINDNMLSQLAGEVNATIRDADRPQMKEIKGLGDRLFGLEQLMHEANKIVQEQNSFAQALLQNQNRAGKVNDPSIFPDLCTSHRKNLMHMLKNHQRVQDIKRRCIKAKEELSENLHVRLKWIMYIEKKLYELDTKLSMHRENVRRLTGLLQVVEQIHRAPRVYVAAITEVARRHAFSQTFVQWATALSAESGEVWHREVNTRSQFLQQFSSHFLTSLFPGLDDLPPDFATQPPKRFDDQLPKLTEEDIQQLRSVLPELASLLIVGEVVAVPAMLRHALRTRSPRTPSVRQESETDTEEFEKVGCSTGNDTSPMEVLGEGRGPIKTKHHFPSQTSDTKHIKLDGASVPPSASPSSHPGHDSYTESSSGGTNGTGGSITWQPAPTRVKTHHVITAGLQQQLEDRDHTILALQSDLSQSKDEAERLQHRLSALAALDCQDTIVSLKRELATLRSKVRDEGANYVNYISELSSRLLDVLLQIQVQTSAEQSTALSEAVMAAKADQDRLQEQLRGTLDVQAHKLSDAQREIEIYQEQLQRQSETLQQTTSEFEEAKRAITEEKTEAVKQLSLEHELEVIAMKERWQEEDSLHQEELVVLTQKLTSLEELLQKAESDRNELERNFQEKFECSFQEEKDKIVQILEVSFSERERKALECLKEQLIHQHQLDVNRLLAEKEEAVRSACKELRTSMVQEWQEVVDTQHKNLFEKHSADLAQIKDKWDQERQAETEAKIAQMEMKWREEREAEVERVRQQYKLELDGLRSRFRMMTTASMDKSPSETSLEKFERGELMEVATHEAGLMRIREELQREKEMELEEARTELQHQFTQAQKEEQLTHEELRKEEKRRIEGEKQVVFNDAIKSVTQDKERVIEDLRCRVELLTDETEKLRRMIRSAAADSTDQIMTALASENQSLKDRCETLVKDVSRLEGEVLRAKRFSFITEKQHELSMSFTDAACATSSVPSTHDDVKRLQQENQELRDKLSRSATSLVERGKISIGSCGPGEAVLLVWDDQHLHYRVLLEANPHLHFLHTDAYTPLHLSKEPPQKMYCIGEVVSKEFCQAKKDENRFRVPKGTKFYRVMAKPIESDEARAMQHSKKDQTPHQSTPASPSQ